MPALKRTELPSEFAELRKIGTELGEFKDCTVVAMSVVTGLPYEACRKALADAGRKDRRGAYRDQQRAAYEALGFAWREWSSAEYLSVILGYAKFHGKKLGQIATLTTHQPRRFPKAWAEHKGKALLLYSRAHVSAMKDGVVQDWAINRSKQVFLVVEITKVAA